MSDQHDTTTEADALDEAVNTANEQILLHECLAALPAPSPHPGFNQGLLATLASGRDFAPWWRQILARVRWMLLPATIGFLVVFGFILSNMYHSQFMITRQPMPYSSSVITPILENRYLPLPSSIIPTSQETIPPNWLKQEKQPASAQMSGLPQQKTPLALAPGSSPAGMSGQSTTDANRIGR